VTTISCTAPALTQVGLDSYLLVVLTRLTRLANSSASYGKVYLGECTGLNRLDIGYPYACLNLIANGLYPIAEKLEVLLTSVIFGVVP
jgi:hypothetical protein